MAAGARLRIPRTGDEGGLGISARTSRLGGALRGTGCRCPAFIHMTDSRPQTQNVRPLRRLAKSPTDRRRALAWYSELRTQSGVLPSMVEDVSAHGAKVRVGSIPIDGENVT